MAHVLDDSLDALRKAFDAATSGTGTRAERLTMLQKPLNDLGAVIQKSIASAAPPDPIDPVALQTDLLKAVDDKLAAFQTQLLATLQGVAPQRSGTQSPAAPVQRSASTPLPVAQPQVKIGPNGVPVKTIHDVVMRSMGFQEATNVGTGS